MAQRPRRMIGLFCMLLLLTVAGQSQQAERQHAVALEQSGDDAGAAAAWNAVLHADPENAEADAHLGLLAARRADYPTAILFYRKALALAPEMPHLRFNLGLSLFKSGDLQGAVQVFAPLLREQPHASTEAQTLTVLLGMAHYGLGEYAAAVPYLQRAAANDPRSLQVRLALAESCNGAKQYQCVLDTYRQILVLNANSAEADMLAGEALEQMHDDPGALAQFRAAAQQSPHEPNVHFGLGYLLWKLKQFPEAAGQFEAELANEPGHAEALAYLGDCRMRLQQPGAAIPLLERASRLDPGLAMVHVDLGALYAQMHRNDDALRELETAARLDPRDPDVHWRLARLYQATGKASQAQAEFELTRTLLQAADQAAQKPASLAPTR